MAHWLNLGQNLKVNAKKFADKTALMDPNRSFTYAELNTRVNRLSHSLLSLGLEKGDRVAVCMENTIEIVEMYLAAAKTGLVIVPVNFRLVGREIQHIVDHSDAKALAADEEFVPVIDGIRSDLPKIPPENFVVAGKAARGWREYDSFMAGGSADEPDVRVEPKDTWILIYTSGTTGKPKGVLRSHESHIAFYLINAVDFGFTEHDVCMNVMPLFHINSTFFTFIFLYIGASALLHPARSFRAGEVLSIVEDKKVSFISLIPTHYNIIMNASEEEKRRDVGSVKKLLCSSAPVRKSMKLAIMDFFKGVELYEGYGSSEAGIVTILKPERQMEKLGSIGMETLGTDFVKILDENGDEVPDGEVGELFSRGPMLFDGYYKMPEKTASSFQGEWFSAGDMARRMEDGFFEIVDRKDNMIITGGEHVYPSEVEEVIGSHDGVFDVAVISLPDEKWGEKVVAVTIPKSGRSGMDEGTIMELCREKLAAYKRPKQVIFIEEEEMPRTQTGKILHRILRERYAGQEASRV
ncbi:Long-chain fatty acid--CoA ligase [Candidatus Desulfarcum epimagneticum]|uniref:Long-chain fatty acid--CoA ligase n=1 Tax=uncultured Desulfobacteraceae bacterium TaxID=218296 RepID=A0A484HPP0_9BACT|nr:Long-chain fatty acid--CoA ligase [uncultured Desulfobacteraceae bacterium]